MALHMESSMKIAWLGSVIRAEAQSKNNAISLASSYWQKSLIDALESLSVNTTTISTMPYRTFPFGPLFIKPRQIDFVNRHSILYGYLNLKWFRDRSKAHGIKTLLALLSDTDALVSYNAYPSVELPRQSIL